MHFANYFQNTADVMIMQEREPCLAFVPLLTFSLIISTVSLYFILTHKTSLSTLIIISEAVVTVAPHIHTYTRGESVDQSSEDGV